MIQVALPPGKFDISVFPDTEREKNQKPGCHVSLTEVFE